MLNKGYHFLKYFEFIGYHDDFEELPNSISEKDKKEATKILEWLKNKQIILTGNIVGEFNQFEYRQAEYKTRI